MNIFSDLKPGMRLLLFTVLSLVIITLCGWGISSQMKAMNQSVNDISDLKDPSPYHAALMGYLGKAHVGLEGFLRSSDPALNDQVVQTRKDFDSAVAEFEHQNPKLFPKIAVDEIRRTFKAYKESVDQTLIAHSKRAAARSVLDQNFAQILSIIDKGIKPLIRTEQADSDERKDSILNVENQARAWQQNLSKAWAQPSQAAMELTYENDNRGSTYLDRYTGLELLSREKKLARQIRDTWQATSDKARESFALEKVVSEAEGFMNGQHDVVVGALNKYLPPMRPAELQARKQGYVEAIRLHAAAVFLLGLVGLVSLASLAIAAYRKTPHGAKEQHAREIVEKANKENATGEPTLQMDLKGMITKWSFGAETLYGYTTSEMKGKPISKLFESESEISRLYKDLLEAPQTVFQTTHRTKDGSIIRVRIEFRPVGDSTGHASAIGLICSRT